MSFRAAITRLSTLDLVIGPATAVGDRNDEHAGHQLLRILSSVDDDKRVASNNDLPVDSIACRAPFALLEDSAERSAQR